MPDEKRVLILCTGDSARSQMTSGCCLKTSVASRLSLTRVKVPSLFLLMLHEK